MTTRPRLLDLDAFLQLPEEKPYLELIDGEVCQKPVGKEPHANAQLNLQRLLLTHPATAAGRPYPELGMHYWRRMDAHNHRVPDVAYFRPGRPRPSAPYPEEPPDLAAEVLSEGQSRRAVRARLAFLREHGVPITLLIDPERETVEVHDGPREWTASAADTVTFESLGGFSFAVSGLFA